MNGKMMIELVIRKENNESKLESISSLVSKYLTSELDNKVILNVPVDWSGFKDGTMSDLLNKFGETMYIALAYFSFGDDAVTDIYGDYAERYNAVIDGRKVTKFVKKNLRIISVIDKDKNIFEAKSFILDMGVVPPYVKLLDVYSGGVDSGIRPVDFMSGNR